MKTPGKISRPDILVGGKCLGDRMSKMDRGGWMGVVSKGFSGEVTEHRLENRAGVGHADVWGKRFPGQ